MCEQLADWPQVVELGPEIGASDDVWANAWLAPAEPGTVDLGGWREDPDRVEVARLLISPNTLRALSASAAVLAEGRQVGREQARGRHNPLALPGRLNGRRPFVSGCACARIMMMRTTLTLADDVAAAVERQRREHSIGMSEAVNELVRAGLASRRMPREPFDQESHDVGVHISVDTISEALETLDGPTGP